jgi:glutaredoxin-like protein
MEDFLMGLLREEDKKAIKEIFQQLKDPVKIVHFTQELNCEYCNETKQLLMEVADLSDKIELDVYNAQTDKEKMQEYEIDRVPALVPATVIRNEKDYGIRYYGIPAGYEFASVLEDIVDVSNHHIDLEASVLQKVQAIDKPVDIWVFVTTSCPYCPRAVRTAHKFAMANENIRGVMIEANEYPQLSMQYSVQAVPKIVINGKHSFEGAYPDPQFAEEVLKAL